MKKITKKYCKEINDTSDDDDCYNLKQSKSSRITKLLISVIIVSILYMNSEIFGIFIDDIFEKIAPSQINEYGYTVFCLTLLIYILVNLF